MQGLVFSDAKRFDKIPLSVTHATGAPNTLENRRRNRGAVAPHFLLNGSLAPYFSISYCVANVVTRVAVVVVIVVVVLYRYKVAASVCLCVCVPDFGKTCGLLSMKLFMVHKGHTYT